MNKKELYEAIKQKISINDKELDEIYNVLKKQMEERGKTKEEDILNRMFVYLTPSLRSEAAKFTGVYLGYEDNFVFNQKTDAVKLDSIKKYQENNQEALDLGYVKVIEEPEKKVIPMWHNVDGYTIQEFQNGKPITGFDYSAIGHFFVEVDGKFELKHVNLRGADLPKDKVNQQESRRDFIKKNNKSLMFKKVQFSAIDKKEKGLNDSKYFNIQVVEDKEVDMMQLFVKYLIKGKQRIDLKDLMKFYQENTDKFIKIKKGYMTKEPVFISGTSGNNFISEFRENNTVEIRDSGYDKQFSVFLPKDIELPNPGTPNVIFGGRLRFNENDKDRPFGMNGFMLYVAPQSRGLTKPAIINKFVITEEEVEDTSSSQQILESDIKVKTEEEW